METLKELTKEAGEGLLIWVTCVFGAIILPFIWVIRWGELLGLLITYPARRRKNIADKARRKLTDDA